MGRYLEIARRTRTREKSEESEERSASVAPVSPSCLVAALAARGGRLRLAGGIGGEVRVAGVRPEDLPPDLLAALRAGREAIRALLEDREERAAIQAVEAEEEAEARTRRSLESGP